MPLILGIILLNPKIWFLEAQRVVNREKMIETNRDFRDGNLDHITSTPSLPNFFKGYDSTLIIFQYFTNTLQSLYGGYCDNKGLVFQ